MIEEWVDGVELSVFVLGEGDDSFALPPVEVVARDGRYDTDARLAKDGARFFAPVRQQSLSIDEYEAQAIRSECERAALEAHCAYGCRDFSRVDMVWDGARAKVLEVGVAVDLGEGRPFDLAVRAAGLSVGAVVCAALDRAVDGR